MSVELREVKRRIGSTRHIGKVTAALQRVASAALARDRRSVETSTAYTNHIVNLLQGIIRSGEDISHRLVKPGASDHVCLIVFGSDRGLCGGYNSGIMDQLTSFSESNSKKNLSLITVGAVPRRRAKKLNFEITDSFSLPSPRERSELLDKLAARITADFTAGTIGRTGVIYTHFISPFNKQAVIRNILPMTALTDSVSAHKEGQEEDPALAAALYDPSVSVVLDRLLPEILRQMLDYAYLHSVCSEDAFRQEAMMRASDNATKMLGDLKLTYSRLRQESITTEMLEIVASGFGKTDSSS